MIIHKDIEVLEFTSQQDFLEWLGNNFSDKSPYWVKLIKKNSKKKGISYEEAREAALIHGWVDGLVNRWDEDFYLAKFTHRRPNSIWSKINIGIIEQLIEENRMHSEGLKEVKQAKKDGRWGAAYE